MSTFINEGFNFCPPKRVATHISPEAKKLRALQAEFQKHGTNASKRNFEIFKDAIFETRNSREYLLILAEAGVGRQHRHDIRVRTYV